MCRHGTWGHGFVVDLAMLGLWLDLMILKAFFNQNDSVIVRHSLHNLLPSPLCLKKLQTFTV